MKIIPNLNFLRAFAILTIVFSHASNWTPGLPPSIAYIIYSGQVGVELFFALSGYLIGCSLLSEYSKYGSINIQYFLAKRVTRIFPPYLVALIAYAIGSYLLEGKDFKLEFLFLAQNYLYQIPFFLGSWAVCIEAHFYIIFPILFIFLDRFVFRFGKILSTLVISLILLIPLASRFVVQGSIYEQMPFGFYQTATHLHYDAIAFGVLAAYLSSKGNGLFSQFNRIALLFCLTLLIAGAFLFNLWSFNSAYVYSPLLLGILSAGVVLALANGVQFRLSSNAIVKILAKISFSIYLAHGIAIHAVNIGLNRLSLLEESDPVRFIVFVGVSILSGFLFYELIEKPLDLRREQYLAHFTARKT